VVTDGTLTFSGSAWRPARLIQEFRSAPIIQAETSKQKVSKQKPESRSHQVSSGAANLFAHTLSYTAEAPAHTSSDNLALKQTHHTMDFNSLKDTVSNLSLYDLKASVRKVQNGSSFFLRPTIPSHANRVV